MKLLVELPDVGVSATVALYIDAAPTVTRQIYQAVATPLETHTAHACFDGHEVYCFLPPFREVPPLENRTMRPRPGEVMFFHAPANAFAVTADDRLSGGLPSVYELAFMYGEVDLRHYWEEGFHGSLVGRMDDGAEAFARACASTLSEGRTALRLSQAP
jgi:hypothetical protein